MTGASYEAGRLPTGRDERVLLFNCGSGLKYPMQDAARHLADSVIDGQPKGWAALLSDP